VWSCASQCLRQFLRLLDILPLRTLVASTQQNHDLRSTMPLPTLFWCPGISLFHAANAGDYARDRIGIPETVQPGGKLPRLTHFDHGYRNVVYRLQIVNPVDALSECSPDERQRNPGSAD
jgi:hypothetical protein